MEGTIHFDLNEPDEVEALFRFMKSTDMALALSEIKAYACNLWNESDDEDTVKVKEVYEKIIGELDKRLIFPDELVS